MDVLLKFSHGLGDAAQLTCVLRHLAKHRPDWTIDVASRIGKHSAFHGQCERSWILDREAIPHQYAQVFDLGWYECYSIYADSPSTKVCNCLREVFGITPERSLLKYRIEISDQAREVTRQYLSQICNGHAADRAPDSALPYPVVAIHYEGNTSAEKKNLAHRQIAVLCRELIEHGYTPLILDWDRRSPLPDGKSIFCPGVGPDDLWDNIGTGDAERLAALISHCALMIGIDSGPLHVAGATETPTIAVWSGHMPVQFFDLCDNVTHLIPKRWRNVPPCQNSTAAHFMEEHYALRTYADVEPALIETALEVLDRAPAHVGAPLVATRLVASAHNAVHPTNGKVHGPAENGQSRHFPTRIGTRRPPMETSILKIPALVTWELVPGSATEIAIGAGDSVWTLGIRQIDSDGRTLHRWNGSHWDDMPGMAAKIAVGPDGTVFTVNGRGQIQKSFGSEWQPMPGLAREIACGTDGALWCVSADDFAPGGGSIHVWNRTDWDRVDGAAVKIAVGPTGEPWIINSAGFIFRRSGEGWELLPGVARELAITTSGEVCSIGTDKAPSGGYSIHRWNGHGWDRLSGAAVRIAAANSVMVINSEHNIFRAV